MQIENVNKNNDNTPSINEIEPVKEINNTICKKINKYAKEYSHWVAWGVAIFTFIFGLSINTAIRKNNEIEVQRMKPLNYSLSEEELKSTGKIKGNGMSWVVTPEGVKFQIKNNDGGFLSRIYVTSEIEIKDNKKLFSINKGISYSELTDVAKKEKINPSVDYKISNYFQMNPRVEKAIKEYTHEEIIETDKNHLGLVFTEKDNYNYDVNFINLGAQLNAFRNQVYIHHLVVLGYSNEYQIITFLYRVGFEEYKRVANDYIPRPVNIADQLISFQSIEIFNDDLWNIKADGNYDFYELQTKAQTSYTNLISFLKDNLL